MCLSKDVNTMNTTFLQRIYINNQNHQRFKVMYSLISVMNKDSDDDGDGDRNTVQAVNPHNPIHNKLWYYENEIQYEVLPLFKMSESLIKN